MSNPRPDYLAPPFIPSEPDEPTPPEAPIIRTSADYIIEECDAIKAMLLEKNRAYGSSALEPLRILSRAPADEQIRVRIDDKLSRLMRGDPTAFGEDVVRDLTGYLVLLLISQKKAQEKPVRLRDRVLGLMPDLQSTVRRWRQTPTNPTEIMADLLIEIADMLDPRVKVP